ncbi:THUMP domain-containing protein 3 [Eurytemora carolleeae]|uniref:THUMP domain-containing protein 3 n=1 Tax=Eurytemora carolleeae TaxID=1294199 RepID=UPI000C7710DB|nr:THUMP domain-containing protein 3 [Eurytemora carolleeae]|eukprot:XP_023333810.1 THUMP domain-containing protein 3-like [Eurytemora affinis]
MAEPLNLTGFVGLDPNTSEICTIEASCVTGFEPMAQEEIQEILGSSGTVHRGRVVFDLPVSRIKEVLTLRTVNNLWVMVGHTHKFVYPEKAEEQLIALADFAGGLDWSKGLDTWSKAFDFKGNLYPTQAGENTEQVAESERIPSFRCSCYRSGTNHAFKSSDAQITVGGRIQDKFLWNVKMKNYDIEVVMNCDVDQVYVGVALNNSSLFNRTLSHFGPTSLRPTICAAMVRLAKVKVGEIVLDPMCGGGSIPLEGSQMDSHAFYLGGEIHDKAIMRTRNNLTDLCARMDLKHGTKMDCLQWSALNPCLRDNSVDVIITDLPFGKRSGSKADNRVLYPQTLKAMARIVRPETGRAVLLTQDKTSMFKTMGSVSKYWKLQKNFSCNIGGLTALIFMFQRTMESP